MCWKDVQEIIPLKELFPLLTIDDISFQFKLSLAAQKSEACSVLFIKGTYIVFADIIIKMDVLNFKVPIGILSH